ncbi:MAG: urease accessory UreF family protein [Corynebacterium sp.]|nr:urease accessory UreF family protein [Corynebacterium sp.]
MATATSNFAYLALTQLGDSALPTGAFAHSFGFESYLDSTIVDANTFQQWLTSFIHFQLTYSDGPATYHAQHATFDELLELDALLYAQTLPAQVREANVAIAQRLSTIAQENYPDDLLEQYQAAAHGHPAIIWGLIARQLDVVAHTAISHHFLSTCIGLTQNAVRSIPIGQSAGQRVIRNIIPLVDAAAQRAPDIPRARIGSMVPGLEIAQMRHERQRARMFMS